MNEKDMRKESEGHRYRRPAEPDTSTAEITCGDGAADIPVFRIPPGGRDGSAPPKRIRTSRYSGASFVRREADADPDGSKGGVVVREYSAAGPLMRRIEVHSWPGKASFYEKFVRDAAISHERHGGEAPHVPYFSYIPQYAQLTASQWAYYLHMRERCESGTALRDADFSYVLLYIYEIINLGTALSPEDGAGRLATVWSLYRKIHPTLDGYMSEWMADYCLSRETPLPPTLTDIIPCAAARSSIKEFYFDAAATAGCGRTCRITIRQRAAVRLIYAHFVTRSQPYSMRRSKSCSGAVRRSFATGRIARSRCRATHSAVHSVRAAQSGTSQST